MPNDQQAQVAEAPPYNRSNGAYISVPGPYEKGVAYTYYIAPPDPSWSAAERAEYVQGKASLLYTSVHEVWPGHFLQFLHSNANPSKIAALWVSYAFAEGWAHYGEELMWEEGLGDGNPEQHIGQLTEALLRNVRYQCAIGLHTQGMSVAQCEQMFREQAYQDPGNARQQAARGTYDPEYLKYTLGKLMIRKLRADWVARAAGRGRRIRPAHLLAGLSRPVPFVWRSADSDGAARRWWVTGLAALILSWLKSPAAISASAPGAKSGPLAPPATAARRLSALHCWLKEGERAGAGIEPHPRSERDRFIHLAMAPREACRTGQAGCRCQFAQHIGTAVRSRLVPRNR